MQYLEEHPTLVLSWVNKAQIWKHTLFYYSFQLTEEVGGIGNATRIDKIKQESTRTNKFKLVSNKGRHGGRGQARLQPYG